MLLLTKGLVQPMGALPSEYVSERVRARAIACLGGPAHAREAAAGMAALVLGSADADLRAQLGEVFDRAGLVCERTDDVIGVEIAGAAKNAAALAAAAAEPHGLNAAGIAAAEIWRECVDYALAQGGRLETFSGLAGVGDLTATVLAPGSRNRHAGELLGTGVPAEQIPGRIGQASEGLDSVPLIAEAVAGAGIEAPGLEGLAALVEGEIDARRVGRRAAARRARAEGGVSTPTRTTLASVSAGGYRAAQRRRTLPPAAKAELDRAFEELYRAHLRDVYSYSYYRVGNHHDAEDLTEQAFLQAYRHFERARRESNGRPLRPWLIRIAHNLASNYHRDRARRPQALEAVEPPMHPHGTEQIVEGREELREVMEQARAPARRPPRGADHALRARHGQPRDRPRARAHRRRDQGPDPPRDQAARGGDEPRTRLASRRSDEPMTRAPNSSRRCSPTRCARSSRRRTWPAGSRRPSPRSPSRPPPSSRAGPRSCPRASSRRSAIRATGSARSPRSPRRRRRRRAGAGRHAAPPQADGLRESAEKLIRDLRTEYCPSRT